MSFDINWDQLVSDNALNDTIREFLDDQFQSFELPSYISNLSVTEFSLGTKAPEITIRYIGNPFDEFYEHENEDNEQADPRDQTSKTTESSSSDEESGTDEDDEIKPKIERAPVKARMALDSYFQLNSSMHSYNMNYVGLGTLTGTETPTLIFNQNPYTMRTAKKPVPKPPSKHENDIQFVLDIDYRGDLYMEVTVDLLVNYPSTNFITLPIKLHISDLVIHSLAAIAYLKNSVYFSFLCDINETSGDYFTSSHRLSEVNEHHDLNTSNGGNFVDYVTGLANPERIDIIKKIRIESEIGEVENNVMRNVGKVERFLIDQLRNLIRDEIAWPGWVCFDLNEEEDEDEEEES